MTTYMRMTTYGSYVLLVLGVACALICTPAASTAQAEVIISQSSSAPTSNVFISHDTSTRYTWFMFDKLAGVDGNPRDVGQTFFIDAGLYPLGINLDKVTVGLEGPEGGHLTDAGYDGQSVTLEMYEFADSTDYVLDGLVSSESGNFPSDLKAAWDLENVYLTFDISDVTLSPGTQYGFMLSHDQVALGTSMPIMVDGNGGYPDGVNLRRDNGVSIEKAGWDMEFYLTGVPVPEPSSFVLAATGLLGLALLAWRRRR